MSAVAENIVATPQIDDAPPAPLVFTDSAANKVKELVDEEGNPDLKLRVFVQGGGCSGFQYGFTFDEIVNDDDTQMTQERRHAADRRDEPAVPGRRRDRLQGRPAGRPVRDQEPERDHDLRLRLELLRLIGRAACESRREAAFSRRERCAAPDRGAPRTRGPAAPVTDGDVARLALDEGARQPGERRRLRPDPAAGRAPSLATTGIGARRSARGAPSGRR